MTQRHFSALELTVPAEAHYLRQVRHLLRVFACDVSADARLADMLLAVNEAATNVVIHAYGEGRGPLHVRACRSGEGVTIEVSDNGTPVAKPVQGRMGGRGLEVIRTVCDDVDIEGPGEYGTRLEMKFKLST